MITHKHRKHAINILQNLVNFNYLFIILKNIYLGDKYGGFIFFDFADVIIHLILQRPCLLSVYNIL